MHLPGDCAAPYRRLPLYLHPYFAAGVMVAAIVGSTLALEGLALPVAGRLALGLLPVLGAVYVLATMARWVRCLDELQRRIMAESLSLAYTLAIVVAVGADSLNRAGLALPLRWEDGLWILLALYALSYTLTHRRYA